MRKILLTSLLVPLLYIGCNQDKNYESNPETSQVETKDTIYQVSLLQDEDSICSALINVKNSIYAKFNEKEMDEDTYEKELEMLLERERIIGKWGTNIVNREKKKVAVEDDFKEKLSLESKYGFNKRYLFLKEKGLSPEAQKDVDNYVRLRTETTKYMKEKIGRETVYESEFKKMVKSYLVNETNFSSLFNSEKEKVRALIGMFEMVKYEGQFETKKGAPTERDKLEKILECVE